jgi:hypothetical protein
VEELREQILAALDDGTCAYLGVFGEKLTAKNFSVDQSHPSAAAVPTGWTT